MRARARTKGRKMPYQRDKPHFTERIGVPHPYRVRTTCVPGGRKWGGGVLEFWSDGVVPGNRGNSTGIVEIPRGRGLTES